ncbi:hypothetical protein LXL04_014511 [Taraxacum kok-saghyz]
MDEKWSPRMKPISKQWFPKFIREGYLVLFEDLCEEILQARLKLYEKIKETNEKFPINLEISEWMPKFDDFFGISSSTDEGDRNM